MKESLISSKGFNESLKENSRTVSRILGRSSIGCSSRNLASNLKFRWPVCWERINRRQMRNDRSPREQWSKIECSLLMFKLVYPTRRIRERERERKRLHGLLYYSGKSSEQNGINHSHWTKTKIETSTAKIFHALNNKFENINRHVI